MPVTLDLILPFMDSRDGTPERGTRAAKREEEEPERLYEKAVGEVSPQASPDEVRPERELTWGDLHRCRPAPNHAFGC